MSRKFVQLFLRFCYSPRRFFGRDSRGTNLLDVLWQLYISNADNTAGWETRTARATTSSKQAAYPSLPCKHESSITTLLLLSPQSRPALRGAPRRASGKRTVGSLGRLHHAAQSVWTHNVRSARKTGCRGWGCKQSRPLPRAVRAARLCPRCSPSPGRELQIRRKQFQKNGVFMSENTT